MIKKKNKTLEAIVGSDDEMIWKQFVLSVSAHIDPVLASMLYVTDLVQFDRAKQVVEVVTLKKFTLFQDLFLQQKHLYQQYLDRLFGFQVTLIVKFNKVEQAAAVLQPIRMQTTVSTTVAPKAVTSVIPIRPKINTFVSKYQRKTSAPIQLAANERTIDITDKQKWKITHALLDSLGGSVREIIKETHELDA